MLRLEEEDFYINSGLKAFGRIPGSGLPPHMCTSCVSPSWPRWLHLMQSLRSLWCGGVSANPGKSRLTTLAVWRPRERFLTQAAGVSVLETRDSHLFHRQAILSICMRLSCVEQDGWAKTREQKFVRWNNVSSDVSVTRLLFLGLGFLESRDWWRSPL